MNFLLPKKIDLRKYEEFNAAACISLGMPKEAALPVSQLLVKVDKLGIFTHGTWGLFNYVRHYDRGGLTPGALPTIASEGPSWAVVDGIRSLGVYNAYFALKVAMKKARETGVSYVGVKNSTHFGAACAYALEAAENGFFALVMSDTIKNMAVPGGRGPIMPNSPIAYAVPAGEAHGPVFMDIATSVVANTKIKRIVEAGGETCPDGWIVDCDGLPTNNPKAPGRALLPFAAHKGYGFSLMIEILAAVLTGGSMLKEVKGWNDDNCPGFNHAIILIDIDKIIGREIFEMRMCSVIEEITSSPKAEGSERIYLPGEMEWEKFMRAEAQGFIELPDDICDHAQKLAEISGQDFKACIME